MEIQKIITTFIFMAISLTINYFLFFKTDKRQFKIACLSIIIISILFYFMDYCLFQNELVDYVASNMLLSFLLSITFEDIKTNMLDMRVIVGYFILFLIYRILFLNLPIFIEGALGFALSLVIMIIAYFVRKNSIGVGDIGAIAACGMIVGFPNIFHFLFKAFLFVFLYGAFLIITKRKKDMNEIPLAPFLLAATII